MGRCDKAFAALPTGKEGTQTGYRRPFLALPTGGGGANECVYVEKLSWVPPLGAVRTHACVYEKAFAPTSPMGAGDACVCMDVESVRGSHR